MVPCDAEQTLKRRGGDSRPGRWAGAHPAHHPTRAAAKTPFLLTAAPPCLVPAPYQPSPPYPPTRAGPQPLSAAMGRAAASTCGLRVLWAAALVAVVGALTITTTTTAAAAAAESGSCCCPCSRGASFKATPNFVEMGTTGRTKPRSMGATVDAGGAVGTMQVNENFVRLVAHNHIGSVAWRCLYWPRGWWRGEAKSFPNPGVNVVLTITLLLYLFTCRMPLPLPITSLPLLPPSLYRADCGRCRPPYQQAACQPRP